MAQKLCRNKTCTKVYTKLDVIDGAKSPPPMTPASKVQAERDRASDKEDIKLLFSRLTSELFSSLKELTNSNLSGGSGEGSQTVTSDPALTNIHTSSSWFRPSRSYSACSSQSTFNHNSLRANLPAQTGTGYHMEPCMGPNVTSGPLYQPGPTHGPHGLPRHKLYNNRSAIIYFDSGLTPQVVTRSSPQGDVNKQPMEVGDTVYQASNGMVKPTRVVSPPLASNMPGILPLQQDDPKLAMPPPGSHMFSSQGDHIPVSGYRVPSLAPALFKRRTRDQPTCRT